LEERDQERASREVIGKPEADAKETKYTSKEGGNDSQGG
jgi:hypothetical protein